MLIHVCTCLAFEYSRSNWSTFSLASDKSETRIAMMNLLYYKCIYHYVKNNQKKKKPKHLSLK